MVSMAAKAAEEGRGAGAGAWTGLAEFWPRAAMAALKKDKRRALRMVRLRLLDERRRILRIVLLYGRNLRGFAALMERRSYVLGHQKIARLENH
jgi:hypothetical protein